MGVAEGAAVELLQMGPAPCSSRPFAPSRRLYYHPPIALTRPHRRAARMADLPTPHTPPIPDDEPPGFASRPLFMRQREER